MFVIVTYDINEKRVNKVMKVCNKYLSHNQQSVFEGSITDASLTKLKEEIQSIIVPNVDEICIYEIESAKYTKKEEIGRVSNNSNII